MEALVAAITWWTMFLASVPLPNAIHGNMWPIHIGEPTQMARLWAITSWMRFPFSESLKVLAAVSKRPIVPLTMALIDAKKSGGGKKAVAASDGAVTR